MEIIKTVTIKQILTDNRKNFLLQELYNEEQQFLKEIDQLKFQLQKKLKKYQGNNDHIRTIRQSFTNEINQREEKLRSVEFKMHQLNKLEVGTEIKDGSVQSICKVEVGDDWKEILLESEIIIKDGIVHEIRKGMKDT